MVIGCITGVTGALISCYSLRVHNFTGLCFGCLLVGTFQASAQFYRLAAGDLVTPQAKQRAVSLVLAGGVIAAFFGPLLAVRSATLWPASLYAGSYLIAGVLTLFCAILLIIGYKEDTRSLLSEHHQVNPINGFTALKQPAYLVATINSVLITSVMMLLMSAAPLAIVQSGWTISDGAIVMQWHLIGMYAPSLIAGITFRKFGAATSLSIGITLTLLAALIGTQSTHSLSAFYWVLCLLGVGWNISFVTSSILLSHGDDIHLKQSAQSASETLRYVFSSIASLAAASALEYSGWAGLNTIMLPLLGIAIISCICWSMTTRAKTSQNNHHSDCK